MGRYEWFGGQSTNYVYITISHKRRGKLNREYLYFQNMKIFIEVASEIVEKKKSYWNLYFCLVLIPRIVTNEHSKINKACLIIHRTTFSSSDKFHRNKWLADKIRWIKKV